MRESRVQLVPLAFVVFQETRALPVSQECLEKME